MNSEKRNLYPKLIFLAVLFLPLNLTSFEIAFAFFLLATTLLLNNKNFKISKDLITALIPLLLLFVWGILISVFKSIHLFDFGKDAAYFLKPILLIVIGYGTILMIKEKKFLFTSIVYLAVIFAIWHLYKLISYPDLFNTSINTLRNDTGLSNHVELLALMFLLIGFKYPEMAVFEQKRTAIQVLILISISFILYFSRTMWVAIFLLLLTGFGYAKISKKAIKYISIVILLIGGFYIYLYSIEIDRNAPGISTFLYKMKIAPEEIFMPKIDLNDHAALWDHWRAYEAKMAINQMNGWDFAIGRGFGSLVDLHFIAPLNNEGMQYISHLHNGYAFLFYKTGFVGLFLYLLFLGNLYLFTFYSKSTDQNFPLTYFIAAIGVYLMFSSLIITGIYNQNSIYTLVLGGLLALFKKQKQIDL
ncbi:MAG: hypothetical protein JW729_07750 [Bacteroidales bacterium]|nr:hypothetical protein [Bacteroidales bacterium]